MPLGVRGPFYSFGFVYSLRYFLRPQGVAPWGAVIITLEKGGGDMDCQVERVTVERKLWQWLKDMVDDRDVEGVRQVLDVMEKVSAL